jgi:hypothetical protein
LVANCPEDSVRNVNDAGELGSFPEVYDDGEEADEVEDDLDDNAFDADELAEQLGTDANADDEGSADGEEDGGSADGDADDGSADGGEDGESGSFGDFEAAFDADDEEDER